MGFSATSEASSVPAYLWSFVKDAYAQTNFSIRQGTWAVLEADLWGGGRLHNGTTKALNDELALGSFNVPDSANYTAYILGETGPAFGILHLILNGTDKGNVDFYHGVGASNQEKEIALASLSAGNYSVRVKMASKNALATDYLLYLQRLIIKAD